MMQEPNNLKEFYEQNRDFYGDGASLEDVARDAYTRFGFDKKLPFKDWIKKTGSNGFIEADRQVRAGHAVRDRGVVGDAVSLGTRAVAGVTLPKMKRVGRSLMALDPDGGVGVVDKFGQNLVSISKYAPKSLDILKPDETSVRNKHQKRRTLEGTLSDIATTGFKSVVGAGETAVGLANIPTLGRAGRFMEEHLGYDPEATHKIFDSSYSPAQKAANEKVAKADGFWGKIKTAVQNPSTIGHAVLESAPLMAGGGAIAQGIRAAGLKAAPWIAAAIGEGAIGAGLTAEQTRQQTKDGVLSPGQSAIAVASGVGTGAIGLAGGRLARKLGFDDVDTLLAGGASVAKKELAKDFAGTAQEVAKRIAMGGISEGVFEELPQSVQEQVWSNAALGQPLTQGIDDAAAMGLLAGAAMGGGINAATITARALDKKADDSSGHKESSGDDKKASDAERVLMDEELGKTPEQVLMEEEGPGPVGPEPDLSMDDDARATSELTDEQLDAVISPEEAGTGQDLSDAPQDKTDTVTPESLQNSETEEVSKEPDKARTSIDRDDFADMEQDQIKKMKPADAQAIIESKKPAPFSDNVLDKALWEVPFRDLEGRFKKEDHRAAVEQSISEGNPVPAEVLADYPDLKPVTDNRMSEKGDAGQNAVSAVPLKEKEIKQHSGQANELTEGQPVTWQTKKGKEVSGKLLRKRGKMWRVEKPDGKTTFVSEKGLTTASAREAAQDAREHPGSEYPDLQTDKENLTVAPGTTVSWQDKKGNPLFGELISKQKDTSSLWHIRKPSGKTTVVSEKSFSPVNADQALLHKNLPKNTIVGGTEEIGQLYDDVVSGKVKGSQKKAIRFQVVGSQEAARLKKDTNLQLDGYNHTVDSFGIRHAHNKHGDNAIEKPRGQRALTKTDFERIPEVINNYDSVEVIEPDKTGRDQLKFTKKYNGDVVYIEAISTGRHDLMIKSMRAYRNAKDDSNEPSPFSTSGNDSRITRSDKQKISDTRTSVKKPDIEQELAATSGQDLDGILDDVYGPEKEKTAKNLAKKAGVETLKGVQEATKGLGKLFSPKNTLGSGPVFDKETYKAAKPHFEKAWAHAKEAGFTVKELVQHLAGQFDSSLRPYLKRYLQEKAEETARVKDSPLESQPAAKIQTSAKQNSVNKKSGSGNSVLDDAAARAGAALMTSEDRQTDQPFDVSDDSTLLENFKYYFVNQLDPLKKVQKSIEENKGPIKEESDTLTKEMLRVSKTKAQINKAEKKYFAPIKKMIGVSDSKVKDVDDFLYARHAREANARLRLTNARLKLKQLNEIRQDTALAKKIEAIDKQFEKNPFGVRQSLYFILLEKELTTPKTEKEQEFKKRWEAFKTKPSGMADAEATQILKRHWNNVTFNRIADKFDAMNKERLDILLKAGRLSQDAYNAMRKTFKYYAPLKREGFNDGPARGSGVQMLGQDIKIRGGSTKRATNILANAMADFQAALIKAEKTKVAKSFLKLLQENPGDDVWQVEPVRKVPGYDDSGNIVEHDDMAVRENEIKLRLDGKVYLISAQNKHALRVINGLKGDTYNTGPIMNGLSRVNRVLAAVNTSLSPEFLITNFARDVQTAAYNLSDTRISKMKARVIKNIPKAMKGLHSHLRGKGSHEWAKTAKEFEESGAKIGWIDFAGDIETRAKKLEKEIDLFRNGHVTKKSLHKLGEWISDYNSIVENAVRLSTFKAGLDAGMTKEKAALMAKDLTVNFNQKGVYGSLINSLYLFSNAGIQGSAKILSVLKNSPKARKMVYVSMAAAVGLAIINRAIGGDDDDGQAFYDKIPEHTKERNMIFMRPGQKGKYIKIPLPWGYNVFWTVGSQIGDAFTKKGYNVTESLGTIMSAIVGAFNPLQSSTLLQTISPTVADPFVQVGENKTWYGAPLMPENNPFAKVKKPQSELYWPSARKISVVTAKSLNKITGGNYIRPGAMDISPEVLDLIWDTFTGSAGRFAVDALSLPAEVMKDDTSLSKIPFARRVMGEKSDYGDRTSYRKNIAHVYQLVDEIKAFPKKARSLKKDKTYRLYKRAKNTDSTLRKFKKAMKAAKDQDRKKNLQERINKIEQNFNKRFFELKNQ